MSCDLIFFWDIVLFTPICRLICITPNKYFSCFCFAFILKFRASNIRYLNRKNYANSKQYNNYRNSATNGHESALRLLHFNLLLFNFCSSPWWLSVILTGCIFSTRFNSSIDAIWLRILYLGFLILLLSNWSSTIIQGICNY